MLPIMMKPLLCPPDGAPNQHRPFFEDDPSKVPARPPERLSNAEVHPRVRRRQRHRAHLAGKAVLSSASGRAGNLTGHFFK